MNRTNLTTIQVEVKTREKLRAISEINEISMADQLRLLINREFGKLPKEIQKNILSKSAPSAQ